MPHYNDLTKEEQQEIKEKARQYYIDNKERIKKRMDLWRRNNPLYQKNYKISHREKLRLQSQKRRIKMREFFLSLKKEEKCAKCGYNEHTRILHFHHIDNKTDNICEMRSKKKVLEEIKKCILLCPNCHALEHY